MSYYTFTPMTDEEINAATLVKDGDYNFQVIKSTRKVSKSNNPMAELQLQIWDNEGKTHVIFDFLVFSAVNMCIKKVKHFCGATGLHEEYKKGQVPELLDGLCGKLSLGTQDEQPNPKGGFYPRKNIVIDYIESDAKVAPTPTSKELMDDIPF